MGPIIHKINLKPKIIKLHNTMKIHAQSFLSLFQITTFQQNNRRIPTEGTHVGREVDTDGLVGMLDTDGRALGNLVVGLLLLNIGLPLVSVVVGTTLDGTPLL